ncbi:hypothetical protein N799_09855 [Lysobacter arseniciresistens ZS79]|uniref:Uncharacterized protein n=1 Tax=Lysobacter arseniciresistens ZS79 TaxID=913325 RepID=A0A0A0EYG1_9GAMM|nr:hypothetical protein [Lysobacter arseniciresistens]KGM54177.1 hypothetical protein N799_09855 [Lysobacter arseniciresistens ZS79]
MSADLRLLRALYWPENLAERGEALAAKLAELSARPHVEACDVLLRDLHQAHAAVAMLRGVLLREVRE